MTNNPPELVARQYTRTQGLRQKILARRQTLTSGLSRAASSQLLTSCKVLIFISVKYLRISQQSTTLTSVLIAVHHLTFCPQAGPGNYVPLSPLSTTRTYYVINTHFIVAQRKSDRVTLSDLWSGIWNIPKDDGVIMSDL